MGFSSSGGAKVGTIELWGGSTAPDGYLLCNGGTVSRSLYSDLFAVIGTTYGAGDGSTTFKLPNYSNARMVTSGDVAIKGNGIALGITDGNQNWALENYGDYAAIKGCMCSSTTSYGAEVGTQNSLTSLSQTQRALGITTDATKSGIVGTSSLANTCRFIIKY